MITAEEVRITRSGAQRGQMCRSYRGRFESAIRQPQGRGFLAGGLGGVAENDSERAAGLLIAPVQVRTLPASETRRIGAQQSVGQEAEAMLATLSLGAIFVVILMSVVMKVFLG